MDNYIQIRQAKLNQLLLQRASLSGERQTQLDSHITAIRYQIRQAQLLNSEIIDIVNNEAASIVTNRQPSHETIIIDDDDDSPLKNNGSEPAAVQHL